MEAAEDDDDDDALLLLPLAPLPLQPPLVGMAADDERRLEDLCVTGNCKVFVVVLDAGARLLEEDDEDSDDELFLIGAGAADDDAPAFLWLEIGAMDEDKEHTERVVSLNKLLRLVDFAPEPTSNKLDWLAWRDPVADVGRSLVTLAPPMVVLVVCSGFLSP